MINKKLSKILGSVLGIVGFILVFGIMNVPASAEENVQVNSNYTNNITTSASVRYEDYSININKSMTQNGIKVTVDKAIATKHKIKAIAKVESTQPFDMKKLENSIFMLTYGDGEDYGFTQSSEDYIDDKTMILTLEKDNYEGEYPQKGDLRIDLVLSNYKVNIGMDIPVDFVNSFNNIIRKDISGNIPLLNYSLKDLEIDEMGTRIIYSRPDKEERNHSNSPIGSIIILKVGDKMYKAKSGGGYIGRNNENIDIYEVKAATYNKIKEEKNISLIPITCNMTRRELLKENKTRNDKADLLKDTINKVNYEKNFNFIDGSKGEIYNIERNDNSIKVYCKGKSELESLLMASNLFMNYNYTENQNNWKSYNSDNTVFYKDCNDSLGYIVEFDNVEKDEPVELYLFGNIESIDKYKLNEEIELLK